MIHKFRPPIRHDHTQNLNVSSHPAQSLRFQQRSYPSQANSAPNSSQVRCHKCYKFGHMADHCRVRPFCSFRLSVSHSTRDFHARQAQSRSHFTRRSSSQQRHQAPSPNVSRNYSQQRHSNTQQNRSQTSQSSTSQQAYLDFHLVQDTHFPT